MHTISGLVADEVLHQSAKNRSLDNLSVVFVAFKRFKEYIEMTNQEYLAPQPAPSINLNPVQAHDDPSSKATPHKPNTSSKRLSDKQAKQSLNSLPGSANEQSRTLQKNSNSIYKLESGMNNSNSNMQQPYANSNASMTSSHKPTALH